MKKLISPLFLNILLGAFVAISCSKKSDSSSTTSGSTTSGSTTAAAKVCLANSVTYSVGSSSVSYTLTRDNSDALKSYSDGNITYTISALSATNVEVDAGSFMIEEEIVNGGLYKSYIKVGSAVSDIAYNYQLRASAPKTSNYIEYLTKTVKGKKVSFVQWEYNGNGDPSKETHHNDSSDFSKIDTTILYTFNTSDPVPFYGGIVTKDKPYFTALDFCKHNVVMAKYYDKTGSLIGVSNYTFDNKSSDGKPGTITITDFLPGKVEFTYNCK